MNTKIVALPKVALIGPAAPYRGGIAQYTTELHKALSRYCNLYTFSFKRLYPPVLYPGRSDKEPGMEGYRLPTVDYTLDIYSPLSLRKTADEIVAARCEVAIISWWTLIWQPGCAYIARRLKKHGIKVVFLCHNLFDHDATGLKRQVSERLLTQADAFIVHSKEAESIIKSLKPTASVLTRLLPIYTQFPAPRKILNKRGRLELLFFGLVRPYKGLDDLMEALGQLKDSRVFLTVVGEAWDDAVELQKRWQDMNVPNLELHLEYVDDQTAANYFARADVVVLPYRSATGSAVLGLAYNYGKPVLATRVGGLPDGVIEGKTGWLTEPNSPVALAKSISNIGRKQLPRMESEIKILCQANSWEKMAEAVAKFLRDL